MCLLFNCTAHPESQLPASVNDEKTARETVAKLDESAEVFSSVSENAGYDLEMQDHSAENHKDVNEIGVKRQVDELEMKSLESSSSVTTNPFLAVFERQLQKKMRVDSDGEHSVLKNNGKSVSGCSKNDKVYENTTLNETAGTETSSAVKEIEKDGITTATCDTKHVNSNTCMKERHALDGQNSGNQSKTIGPFVYQVLYRTWSMRKKTKQNVINCHTDVSIKKQFRNSHLLCKDIVISNISLLMNHYIGNFEDYEGDNIDFALLFIAPY